MKYKWLNNFKRRISFHFHILNFCSQQSQNFPSFPLINRSRTGFIVVSPHYRRAPEFPFPTPLTDCYDALRFCSSPDLFQVCFFAASCLFNFFGLLLPFHSCHFSYFNFQCFCCAGSYVFCFESGQYLGMVWLLFHSRERFYSAGFSLHLDFLSSDQALIFFSLIRPFRTEGNRAEGGQERVVMLRWKTVHCRRQCWWKHGESGHVM